MRKLLLVAVVAASLGGCVIVDDDAGYYDLEWNITSSGFPTSCEQVGADTVEVLATLQQTGEGFADLFDCYDYAGMTSPLPLGDYVLDISLIGGGFEISGTGPFAPEPLLFDGDMVSLIVDFPTI